MKTRLVAPPWSKPQVTEETIEAIQLLRNDVWRDASIRFAAERDTKTRLGKNAPKGMQKFLNEVIHERFISNKWLGEAGYYFKKKTWIRVAFRHQMSLGSDILDAIKVCKKEGIEQAVIFAASRKVLDTVSPNDAGAIISFEKLENMILSLDGVINDVPLLIGELTPITSASKDIVAELKKERPRDVTIPIERMRMDQ